MEQYKEKILFQVISTYHFLLSFIKILVSMLYLMVYKLLALLIKLSYFTHNSVIFWLCSVCCRFPD